MYSITCTPCILDLCIVESASNFRPKYYKRQELNDGIISISVPLKKKGSPTSHIRSDVNKRRPDIPRCLDETSHFPPSKKVHQVDFHQKDISEPNVPNVFGVGIGKFSTRAQGCSEIFHNDDVYI